MIGAHKRPNTAGQTNGLVTGNNTLAKMIEKHRYNRQILREFADKSNLLYKSCIIRQCSLTRLA